MFIEVQTIWKNMPPDLLFAIQQNSPPCNGPAQELEKWACRRVGVLFSRQDGIWTFIVLIGPEKEELGVDRMVKEVTGPERGFLHLQVDEHEGEEIANASWRNGKTVLCKEAQHGVENMINYITTQLTNQGPHFLQSIVREIFWGWGEFLKQMRLSILKVIFLIHRSF